MARFAGSVEAPWAFRGLRRRAGFTLAEILVVLAILAILGLCVIRATEGAAARADVVRCMGNLRNLHLALAEELTEQGTWPQCPFEIGEAGYDDWWVHALSKDRITAAVWTCPTLMRSQHLGADQKRGEMKIHYVPTQFDANPFTPRRWSSQPWVSEIADSHGEGNLMVFPDGSIIGLTRFLASPH